MKDFEKKIDEIIIPLFREKLMDSYLDGYKQSFIDNYIKNYNLSIADFGLKSGTIWIIRIENITFREAQQKGLIFPTKDQIEELLKCKWRDEQFDAWHMHVLGPNGYEIGVFDSCHSKLCFWTPESHEDEDYKVDA